MLRLPTSIDVNSCESSPLPPPPPPPTSPSPDALPLIADRVTRPPAPAPLPRPEGVCAASGSSGAVTAAAATDCRDEIRAPLTAERVVRAPGCGLLPPLGVAGTMRGGFLPFTAVLQERGRGAASGGLKRGAKIVLLEAQDLCGQQ